MVHVPVSGRLHVMVRIERRERALFCVVAAALVVVFFRDVLLAVAFLYLVHFRRTLIDQVLTDSVLRLDILLFDRFYRYKTRQFVAQRITDRLSVSCVILVTFDERFDILRRDQAGVNAPFVQLSSPMMRSSTPFHRHLRIRPQALTQGIQPLIAFELL